MAGFIVRPYRKVGAKRRALTVFKKATPAKLAQPAKPAAKVAKR